MLVFGTRPEAIKMCPLVRELQSRPDEFETVVCVSGQHREMLDQVLRVFKVEPDHDLHVMRPGQTLFDVTCDVLRGLKPVMEGERPDCVLVHGDTTTSFAAALAAFYLQIPVGHVEAGLRTRNLYSPWPEEFNRQAVDVVSRWYFAPTETSRQNLLDEAKPADRIFVTGNTGIDALRHTVREGYSHPVLDWAEGSRLVLITAHRRENLGEPMHRMFRAIRRVMEERPDVKAVYPIHMNPQVRRAAHEELDGFDRLRIIDPLEVVTRAASRRKRPASANPCSSCATPPSAPRASRPARSGSSAPARKISAVSLPACSTIQQSMPPCRTPPTPTATDTLARGLPVLSPKEAPTSVETPSIHIHSPSSQDEPDSISHLEATWGSDSSEHRVRALARSFKSRHYEHPGSS